MLPRHLLLEALETRQLLSSVTWANSSGYYNGFWTTSSRQMGTHTDAYFIQMGQLLDAVN